MMELTADVVIPSLVTLLVAVVSAGAAFASTRTGAAATERSTRVEQAMDALQLVIATLQGEVERLGAQLADAREHTERCERQVAELRAEVTRLRQLSERND